MAERIDLFLPHQKVFSWDLERTPPLGRDGLLEVEAGEGPEATILIGVAKEKGR